MPSKPDGSSVCIKVGHHISGIWAPYPGDDPLSSGSRGAGVLVGPYSRACLETFSGETPESPYHVSYGGSSIRMRPLDILARENPPPPNSRVIVELSLPPGRGYATSAVASMAYALLVLWGKRGFHEAIAEAHSAEVRALTGLGDVSSITLGRMVNLRRTPGPPPRGVVDSYPVPRGVLVLSVSLGSMETRDMLVLGMDVFRKYGEEALSRLERDPGFDRFLEEARWFSEQTGQLKPTLKEQVSELGSMCRGCIIGYYVKKTLLTLFVEKDWAPELPSLLQRAGLVGEFSSLHRLLETGVLL